MTLNANRYTFNQRFLHWILAVLVLVLGLVVLLHMAAGIKHWRLKDGVMTRISLP